MVWPLSLAEKRRDLRHLLAHLAEAHHDIDEGDRVSDRLTYLRSNHELDHEDGEGLRFEHDHGGTPDWPWGGSMLAADDQPTLP